MAVGFVLEFANVGQDKYDAVMKDLKMAVGSNANYPDGIITHAAGKSPTGWCVVDLWESEAAFGRFREDRLGAALAKNGLPEPKVTKFELYNRFPR